MSMHSQAPTRLSRIGYYIGPFALLSVVTSVAFNRAILARERGEQRRLHQLQMSLLNQLHSEASSQASTSSSPLLGSIQEQKRLARRMRALQLDPLRVGFSRQVLPSREEEEKLKRAKEATTSWATALFGSGTIGKLRKSVGKAREAMRERGFGSLPIQTSTSEEDEADAAWVRALEESLEDIDRSTKDEVPDSVTTEMDVGPSLKEEESIDGSNTQDTSQNAAPTQYKRRIYA